MSSAELLERKRTLIIRRDELLSRLNAIKADFGRGLDKDWEEQAIQLENAEVLTEISRVTAEELNKVDAAIQRLDNAISQQHS